MQSWLLLALPAKKWCTETIVIPTVGVCYAHEVLEGNFQTILNSLQILHLPSENTVVSRSMVVLLK